MITKSRQKSPKKYSCKKCHYTSRNRFDFDKHLTTTKHKMVTNGNEKSPKVARLTCDCGRNYKFKSGLSRHQKKCKYKMQKKTENSGFSSQENAIVTKELVMEMIKQREQTQELINLCKDRQIINYQNCGNKKMTINVFLNEKCKDAMNLTDFVENLEVSLKDLEYTNEHGYVKGISNIITKHLTGMKPTERPIHCCDKKRLQFYVKDEDRWEKDDKNVKIDKSIQEVTFKQIKKLKEWEEKHPGYLDNDALLIEWHSMLHRIMGGAQDEEKQKNKEQIKKQISENIELKDAMKDD
jgi:hypothetical protein